MIYLDIEFNIMIEMGALVLVVEYSWLVSFVKYVKKKHDMIISCTFGASFIWMQEHKNHNILYD